MREGLGLKHGTAPPSRSLRAGGSCPAAVHFAVQHRLELGRQRLTGGAKSNLAIRRRRSNAAVYREHLLASPRESSAHFLGQGGRRAPQEVAASLIARRDRVRADT